MGYVEYDCLGDFTEIRDSTVEFPITLYRVKNNLRLLFCQRFSDGFVVYLSGPEIVRSARGWFSSGDGGQEPRYYTALQNVSVRRHLFNLSIEPSDQAADFLVHGNLLFWLIYTISIYTYSIACLSTQKGDNMHSFSRLEQFHRRLAGESLSNLAGVLGAIIPAEILDLLRDNGQRQCVFTPIITFWSFLSQVLSPRQPCREAVRSVQASRQRRGKKRISPLTGGYCQARRRLPKQVLERAWQQMADNMANSLEPQNCWLGLRVAVTDGTTVSMPDSLANQHVWPQPSEQKKGCGFPVMKLVTIFNLATGAICALAQGNLYNAEHALFQKLWPFLTGHFDVLLGDRNFCSYTNFCALRAIGMHGVFRLHQARKLDFRQGKKIGKNDRLVVWQRPQQPTGKMPKICLRALPEILTIRIVKILVPIRGFRTRVVLLATDLLDPKAFPLKELANLYLLRWQAETCLGQIKTIMNMDILRCTSPEMIRRELHMHIIAYNAVRSLMLHAAIINRKPLSRISFKGTCDALRQFCPHLILVSRSSVYGRLFRLFLWTIANDLLPHRPNRSEPRAVKRRPKKYHLLNKPRCLMGNLPHTNKPS